MKMFKLVLYYVLQGVSQQLTPILCSYLEWSLRYTRLNMVGVHLKIPILTKNAQHMLYSI